MIDERMGLDALRAYVAGETSEPVVLSAFRGVAPSDRVRIVSRHRDELAAIDGPRALMLESLLLPLGERRG